MERYYRIDLHFGKEWEVSEKEFNRKIKSKWYLLRLAQVLICTASQKKIGSYRWQTLEVRNEWWKL